jgi:hypothetical protein
VTSTILCVEPEPSDPTLWRYGRMNEAGELPAVGVFRYRDGTFDEVDDPPLDVGHDAVTAMLLVRRAGGVRRPIHYDVEWRPLSQPSSP